MALRDACVKSAGQPLYEFMGAVASSVPVYASGLSFVNGDGRTREVYENERFAEPGEVHAAKVEVGHESVHGDLRRLELVEDAMGGLDRLLIDPDEAWSPAETLRRLGAFREAGVDVFRIEDPVFRSDLEGMGRVVENTPDTHVTVGEYVGFERKHALLDAGACDVLNLRPAGAVGRAPGRHARPGDRHAGRAQHRPRHRRDGGPRRTGAPRRRRRGVLLPPAVGADRRGPLRRRGRPGRVRPAGRPGHGVAFDDATLATDAR